MTSSPPSGLHRMMRRRRDGCSITVVIYCSLLTLSALCAADDEPVPVPPEITEHPALEVAFKSGEPVTLKCRAVGSPELKFQWTLNGDILSVDAERGINVFPNGSLLLTKPENGTYQCFVSNSYGTAVSVKSSVKAADEMEVVREWNQFALKITQICDDMERYGFTTMNFPTQPLPHLTEVMKVLERFPTLNRVQVHRVVAGKPVKFQCEPPASYPTGNIYWGVHGNDGRLFPVDNTDRVTLDYDGSLHFTNVLPSDNTSSSSPPFICVVYNPLLRSLVQGSDQRIEVLPGLPSDEAPTLAWSSPSTAVVVKGTLLRMKCIFYGYPTPRITWSRVDGQSSSRPFFTNSSHGQELIVNQVDFEDAGQYECSATNTATTTAATHAFSVIVESKPYWKHNKLPANVDAMEEDDVRFECHVSGIPKPNVTWSINGIPIDLLSNDPRRTVGADFLAYTNVTKTDTAVFQCNASNTHGYIFANAYLRVRAEPPSIIQTPDEEMKIAKGQGAVFPCRSTGAPIPTLNWFKNSEIVAEEPDQIILHSSGSLEIKNARLEDAGKYECIVLNKFGTDKASSQLTVLDNMALTGVPQSEATEAASLVELKCVIRVDPRELSRLQVTWFKDGSPLDDPRVTTTVSSDPSSDNEAGFVLLIPESIPSDTGRYTCRAATDVETVEHTVELLVKDRPDPPFDIELTDCKSESTTVSFTPGNSNNDPITNFTVYFKSSYKTTKNENEIENENEHADEYQAAFVVPGNGPYSGDVQLEPWRNYSFYVVAQNSVGTSRDGDVTRQQCTTPAALPDANPTNVCAEQRGSNELVIVWQPIAESHVNGEQLRYVITYKQLDIEDAEVQTTTVYGVEKNEVIIPDQEPFRQYEVTVQSVNEVGQSYVTSSRTVVHSGQDYPSIVPNNFHVVEDSLNSTSVSLAWDSVDQNWLGVNGFLIGYSVSYWNDDTENKEVRTLEIAVGDEVDTREVCWTLDNDDVDTSNVMPKSLPTRKRRSTGAADEPLHIVINDLWPYSNISASVAIINTVGIGSPSEPIHFTTEEGVPSQVPLLVVTECGATHMKLQWPSPDEINGVLKGYNVKYVDSDGNTWAQFVTGNDVAIYDLEDDNSYIVSVCAETVAGCGEENIVERRTLLDGPPDIPEVRDIALGSNWANVSWKVKTGEASTRPASEHYVEIREESSKIWRPTSTERSTSWINITQLRSPAEYVVRIVAVSSPQFKSYSDEKTFPLGLSQPQKVLNEPVSGASATPLWLIVVICIVAAVCLIVLIVCIVKRRRSPARYAVKERAEKPSRPNDEEKALTPSAAPSSKKEPDARSTTPATPNTLATSSASLISNRDRRPDDDDSDSLDDGPDVTKFNEDGSFIGLYGPDPVPEDNAGDDDESRLLVNGTTPTDSRPTNGSSEVSNTQNV